MVYAPREPLFTVFFFLLVCWCGLHVTAAAPTPEEWRGRTVYQLLTDRFATDACGGPHAPESKNYMGGTWAGMRKRLGYLQELGFDAVWFSPITAQCMDTFGTSGYAGYWPSDWYQVNPAFGTHEELQELVQYYQQNGVYMLFDLVINHVGYGDFATYQPFNKTDDFHDCNGCPGLYCSIDSQPSFTNASSARPAIAYTFEHCKLSGLPDLNHSDPSVLARMVAWQTWVIEEFQPDGLRYDAVSNSLPTFVGNLTKAAKGKGTWTIGELFLEEPLNTSTRYLANYLQDGLVFTAFSFPMEKALRLSLRERKKSMTWLAVQRKHHLRSFGDKVHDLGSFLENHDMERWLAEGYSDYSRYMNGMVYVLFMEGIPFVYYGMEYGFTEERPPLWNSNFAHNTGLWLFLRVSVHYRKLAEVWQAGVGSIVHVDDDVMVLERGPFVIVLTSVGEDPGRPAGTVLTIKGLQAPFAGRSLSNIYDTTDQLKVSSGGVGLVKLATDGKPQVFYAGEVVEPMSLYTATPDLDQKLLTIVIVMLALALPVVLLTLLATQLWARKHHYAGNPPPAAHKQQQGWFGAMSAGLGCMLLGHSGVQHCHDDAYSQDASNHSGAAGRISSKQALNSNKKPSAAGWFRQLVGRGTARHASQANRITARPSSNGTADVADLKLQWGVDSQPHAGDSLSRLHQVSMRQSQLALGSPRRTQQHIDIRAASAAGSATLNSVKSITSSSGSTGEHSERIEAFSGSSAIFTHPTRMSAVDLAQGAGQGYLASLRKQHQSFTDHGAHVVHFGRQAGSVSSAGRAPSNGSLSSTTAMMSSMPSVTLRQRHPSHVTASGVTSNDGTADGLADIASAASLQATASSKTADRLEKGQCSAGQSVAGFDAMSTNIMHVALEYALPHLNLNNQLMYGGLGMVVATFLKDWPGPLSLLAPLYKPCYDGPNGSTADGGSGSTATHPFFVPADTEPLLEMTVDVAGQLLPVEVFKVELTAAESASGHPRTFYLVQSELFRYRSRGDIYSFQDEDEMLAWLAVFNQAIAAVVVAEGITHVQLHDYHGGLSVLYVPERLRPALLYVAHNAHYDAVFPIPTPARRRKVYSYLGLNAEATAAYVEHNGGLDILRAVVMYIRDMQQGHGVVAVSPRYAAQICEKLSVFWSLSPIGRPRTITGILNAMDTQQSLAASGMSLQEVLAAKTEAKLKLQEAYGLVRGEEYTLLVFVGRITHQKGCDIIAEAAAYMMAHHPTLQLVVVGPTGDAVGAAASAKLAALGTQYPGRMFCPQDHYVAGDEKHMLLCATDFCLIPSRFEPCGLVDIEFGWQGALMIGHDTGGLGKMPGIYFTAQASHLSHLARKLEAAVDRAMALSREDRSAMIADGLSKRFPADDMMEAYGSAWQQINKYYCRTLRARRRRLQFLHDHAYFFANKWERLNKKGVLPAAAAAAAAATSTDSTAERAGPLGTAPGGSSKPTYNTRGSLGDGGIFGTDDTTDGGHRARCTGNDSGSSSNFPAAQQLSNYLLVVLQYWGLGPGVLLCTLLLLREIRVNVLGKCGLHSNLPHPAGKHTVANGLFHWTKTKDELVPQLLLFFLMSTVCFPLWSALAAHITPRNYIRFAVTTIAGCYCLAFVAIFQPVLIDVSIIPIGGLSLVGIVLLSLGFLGEDGIEVSEVGRRMLTVSESVKYGVLCSGMLLAAVSHNAVAHLVVAGIAMLLSMAMLAWFWHPASLSTAYQHMALTYSGQFALLRHLSCFWYTLVASACDSLTLMLTGFLVIATTSNLAVFASYQAIAFGCCMGAIAWNYAFLSSRVAELHLGKVMMGLAAMPFYSFLKAIVLVAFSKSNLVPGAPNTAAMLAISAAIDLFMGGRSSITGLAGFLTMPSREVVSIWQLAAVALSSVAALLILGVGSVAVTSVGRSIAILFGVIGLLEFIRAGCMVLMARSYNRENLSAP